MALSYLSFVLLNCVPITSGRFFCGCDGEDRVICMDGKLYELPRID